MKGLGLYCYVWYPKIFLKIGRPRQYSPHQSIGNTFVEERKCICKKTRSGNSPGGVLI